jgi:hypothetical protein
MPELYTAAAAGDGACALTAKRMRDTTLPRQRGTVKAQIINTEYTPKLNISYTDANTTRNSEIKRKIKACLRCSFFICEKGFFICCSMALL